MAAVPIIASLLLLCACAAQASSVMGRGKCPDVAVVQNFDEVRYQGVWYQASGSIPMLELGGTCPKLQYTLDPKNGNFAAVYTTMRNGKELRMSAQAVPVDRSKKEGNYVATVDVLSVYLFGNLRVSAPYKVVGTDYDNFVVVFACKSMTKLMHGSGVVVLTRKRQVDAAVQKKIDDVIKKAGLSNMRSVKSQQSNCKD